MLRSKVVDDIRDVEIATSKATKSNGTARRNP